MKNTKIILLFVLILVIGLVARPYGQSVDDKRTELESMKVVQEAKKEEFKQLEEFKERAEQGKTTFYVPKGIQQAELIGDIERIIAQAGFSLDGYGFAKGFHDAAGLNQIATQFQLEGSRSNLLRFMQLVEQNPRVMEMEGLSLSQGEDGRYSLGARLNIFYQEDKK